MKPSKVLDEIQESTSMRKKHKKFILFKEFFRIKHWVRRLTFHLRCRDQQLDLIKSGLKSRMEVLKLQEEIKRLKEGKSQ